MSSNQDVLCEIRDNAVLWYTKDALPLWAKQGWDEVHGGFHDKLNCDAKPEPLPKRCRVQARQIFSLLMYPEITGHSNNPYIGRANEGFNNLLKKFRYADGSFSFVPLCNDNARDPVIDNYDQAFVLLASSHLYQATQNPIAYDTAMQLMSFLETNRQHPMWGFYEHDKIRGLQKTNPHMHFLEAFLSWAKVDPTGPWLEKATSIITGALNSVIDTQTGVVREFSDLKWDPLGDPSLDQVEPGHLFEWASLLFSYSQLTKTNHLFSQIQQLYKTATSYGIAPDSNLIHSKLTHKLAVQSTRSRFWSHTERVKTALIMPYVDPENSSLFRQHVISAWTGLSQYLKSSQPLGLWFDWIDEEGRLVKEPSPASSLYHIANAIFYLKHMDIPH